MTDIDLVSDLLESLNKRGTGTKAYLQGDHAEHTWGLPIPPLAFQWVIGGSSILPCQRYFGVSGIEKSFKSTLMVEIGNWFLISKGVHVHLDTENKTSPLMLEAMTWHRGIPGRILKVCRSIDEWQTMVTTVVERARSRGAVPKGERVPVFITIDSLTARSTEENEKTLRKEGAAAQRGYPIGNLQITNFLETLNLLGTTVSIGWVQHMKQSMDQTGYGTKYKEKGASAAQFACSTHLRVAKAQTPIRLASHPSAPYPDIPVEGHNLWIETARSCVGPGGRVVPVNLLWQYVPQDDGSTKQAMWFDWHGSLGQLLRDMKFSDSFKNFKADKDRLNETLFFSEPRTNHIKCDELELDGASYTEFGKAIFDNNEVYDRVSRYLDITEYPSLQEAEIDFEAGDISDSKKKGRR